VKRVNFIFFRYKSRIFYEKNQINESIHLNIKMNIYFLNFVTYMVSNIND